VEHPRLTNIRQHRIIEYIVQTRQRVASSRSILIAITGIDGSGKGYVSAKLANVLGAMDLGVANINIDGWLNLPHLRFNKANPAEHFYLNAIRFTDMFAKLIFPLRNRRSFRIEMDFAAETATGYRKQLCAFDNIDVILLDGIYLLKEDFQNYYDLSFWIDCSFETALERAIARAQEGLPPEETVHAYRSIYFPAQEIHFARDNPRRAATAIINNDLRLGPVSGELSSLPDFRSLEITPVTENPPRRLPEK
jgi:uridine kinase